jgi:hypothetical protein
MMPDDFIGTAELSGWLIAKRKRVWAATFAAAQTRVEGKKIDTAEPSSQSDFSAPHGGQDQSQRGESEDPSRVGDQTRQPGEGENTAEDERVDFVSSGHRSKLPKRGSAGE